MAIETSTPRSRRAILAAALGAGAATIASALGRPISVKAADGDIVKVGHTYTASTTTAFDAGASGAIALFGSSTATIAVYGSSTSGDGVHGFSSSATGVSGNSGSSDGVHGASTSGDGVHGESTTGHGVVGEGRALGMAGVKGHTKTTTSVENYGVYGETHGPASRSVFGRAMATSGGTGAWGQADSPSGTGVRGLAWNAAGGTGGYGTGVIGSAGSQAWPAARVNTGVMGVSPGGTGVFGSATTGSGAYGYATTTGVGARGYSVSGTGGYFSTSGAKVGTALRAIGKVKLDNCAGVATIAAGTKSVVVTPGIDLLATSAVVATLQGTPVAGVVVASVAVNATADTFTVYLTANATAAVTVAWHVFG